MVRMREGVKERQDPNTFWNETVMRKEGGKEKEIDGLIGANL